MFAVLGCMQRMLVFLVAFINILGFNTHTVSVDLYANPSSGYVWECSFDEEGILVMTDSYYTPDASTIFTGKGGGTKTFTFKAISSGTVKVRFDYVKIIDGEKITASGYTYVFNVDENGLITNACVQ